MNALDDFVHRCYLGWIDLHVPKDEIVGNCTIYARVMKAVFPELIHVGGYVCEKVTKDDFWDSFDPKILGRGRRHYHEYLRSPEGTIVDPTGKQFGGNPDYLWCEEHLIT